MRQEKQWGWRIKEPWVKSWSGDPGIGELQWEHRDKSHDVTYIKESRKEKRKFGESWFGGGVSMNLYNSCRVGNLFC